jgi:hypothetical protein
MREAVKDEGLGPSQVTLASVVLSPVYSPLGFIPVNTFTPLFDKLASSCTSSLKKLI